MISNDHSIINDINSRWLNQSRIYHYFPGSAVYILVFRQGFIGSIRWSTTHGSRINIQSQHALVTIVYDVQPTGTLIQFHMAANIIVYSANRHAGVPSNSAIVMIGITRPMILTKIISDNIVVIAIKDPEHIFGFVRNAHSV